MLGLGYGFDCDRGRQRCDSDLPGFGDSLDYDYSDSDYKRRRLRSERKLYFKLGDFGNDFGPRYAHRISIRFELHSYNVLRLRHVCLLHNFDFECSYGRT
jgi:hypothetical protein